MTSIVEGLDRITFNPEVMGGKPCIRGMRVTVGMVVGLVAAGVSNEEILQKIKDLGIDYAQGYHLEEPKRLF